MRLVCALAPLLVLAWLPAAGQQNADAVLASGAGVTAPVPLPSTVTVSTPKHCEELDGVVKFAGAIDAAGVPHELRTLETSDNRLTSFATETLEIQLFKPATQNGSATTVAGELTVGLHTCAQRDRHATDGNLYQFTLRAHPLIGLEVVTTPAVEGISPAARTETAMVEQVGEHISAPVPTVVVDPQIPVSRKFLKRGFCLVSVTIDANGVPENVHVFRGLEPELDSYAMEAAKGWRFKPALRDGSVPVAVEGTIAATFAYVEKEPVAVAMFFPKTPDKVLAANSRHSERRYELDPVNADEVIARYKPHNRIAGLCLVSLVVDTNGVPQNVHVVRSLDSSLDTETVAMFEQLRFKPVTVTLLVELVEFDFPTWF